MCRTCVGLCSSWSTSYVLLLLLLVFSRAESDDDDFGFHDVNVTRILNHILDDVDPRVRPKANGPPVRIYCSFYIISFGSINEVDMDYTMDIFMRQRWTDPRMAFTITDKPMVIPASSMHLVWVPDIFFPNEKKASFHDVTVPNRLMRVYPNGTIVYSVRITMTLSCPMVLTHFPMDSQECFFKIESYGHETDDLLLLWSPDGIEVNEDLTLPQFDLISIERINCTKSYATGNFSCLKVSFSLQRQFGFYLLQTYIPSILIVILSWVSFWINMDAVPARISLGVTTVLTMTTQLSGSRANLPKVSYPKAMDVWMAACMFFVFGALLEYAFVNVLGRRSNQESVYKKTDTFTDQDDHCEEIAKEESKLQRWKRYMQSRQAASYLDKASRILFPTGFLLFNVIYWTVYMMPRCIDFL